MATAAAGGDGLSPCVSSAGTGADEWTGRIISVLDGVSRVSSYQIVTLNRGAQAWPRAGHVLAVWQAGEKVADRFGGGKRAAAG
jgi:predicted lipoprotein with Yx(FWY)xxD motif